MMNKIFISLLIFISGCSFFPGESKIIRIAGSDTMYELTLNLAGEFMVQHPGISVTVSGGGTATGIKALINDEADICTASRNLKPEESKLLAEYYNSIGLVFLIAKDALSIYLNPYNPVKFLTLEQLKDIYTGRITNWKSLGGKDTNIVMVSRNPNSGTYLYFKDHVLEGEEYSEKVVIKPTTREVIDFVASAENAVGYGGMGYGVGTVYARINGVEPTEENVRNDSYPIIRYLHFFTTKSPGGIEKMFIDWVLSPAGQNIVRKSGYIPLWENKL